VLEYVLASGHPDLTRDFKQRAKKIGATAVFDGVGGALISQIIGSLPPKPSMYFYGFLSGQEKVAFHSAVFMFKDLRMKRFGNFETVTVKDGKKRAEMFKDLEGCIDDPLFRTSLGKDFKLEEVKDAMEYEGGAKRAVFVVSK
jgi:NADPH:quinone reductase